MVERLAFNPDWLRVQIPLLALFSAANMQKVYIYAQGLAKHTLMCLASPWAFFRTNIMTNTKENLDTLLKYVEEIQEFADKVCKDWNQLTGQYALGDLNIEASFHSYKYEYRGNKQSGYLYFGEDDSYHGTKEVHVPWHFVVCREEFIKEYQAEQAQKEQQAIEKTQLKKRAEEQAEREMLKALKQKYETKENQND